MLILGTAAMALGGLFAEDEPPPPPPPWYSNPNLVGLAALGAAALLILVSR